MARAMPADLPTERDFDPYGGDLDAQYAWRNFGGLTLEEANKRFRENPEVYQEDFMFMGGTAFGFYFPVIDGFLRDTSDKFEDDDRQAWILAHCIMNQFQGEVVPEVRRLVPGVLELAEFVLTHIRLFAPSDTEEQHRIAGAWLELKDHVRQCPSG